MTTLTFTQYALLWCQLGTLFCLLAVWVFRREGTTARRGELYLAVIGPLFGPIIAILMLNDLLKERRDKLARRNGHHQHLRG